mgnify:CR=1 FL=1
MSLCRKCDRCGGFWEPLDTDTEPYDGWIEKVKVTDAQTVTKKMLVQRRQRLDLCPKCLEDFEHFMEGTPLATDILKEENQWNKPAETPEEMEEELRNEPRSNLDDLIRLNTKQVNTWLKELHKCRNSHQEHGL